jgi:hypothetical protein
VERADGPDTRLLQARSVKGKTVQLRRYKVRFFYGYCQVVRLLFVRLSYYTSLLYILHLYYDNLTFLQHFLIFYETYFNLQVTHIPYVCTKLFDI